MRHLVFILSALLLFNACQKSDSGPAGEAKRYDLKGKVVSVDREKKKAKIDHEAIEGYMPAMEMDFPIHEDWVWDDLTPGAEIRATLVVDNTAKDPYWLEKIGILAAPRPGQPVHRSMKGLRRSAGRFPTSNSQTRTESGSR